MKMVITAKCGHKEEIEVTGNQKNRDRQIWSAEHSDCIECSQKKIEARDASAGFVDLEGSEKQIAWAKQIRRGIIGKIENAPMGSAENEKIKADVIEKMENNRSAKWWIDVRDMTLVNVVREVLKEMN